MKRYFGKIMAAAIIICFVLPSFITITAQSDSKKYKLTFKITFSEDQLLFDSLEDYNIILLADGGHLAEPRKTMLPVKNIMIALAIEVYS